MGRHKRKRPYRDQIRPCCAKHLEEWDCYCTFGCDACWVRWICSKCSNVYGDGGQGTVREHLRRKGLLGARLEVFKVQRSITSTAECEQIMVYNKSHSVMYEVGSDTLSGKELTLLFGKTFKVFVLGAWSSKMSRIVAYEQSRNWSW